MLKHYENQDIFINNLTTMGQEQNEVTLLTKNHHQQIPDQNIFAIVMSNISTINQIVEKRGK